ncbi:YdcF family protein [Peribacillus loiseleuriae]|uniref:DUF218 domain-containing protein n=1 Tax=Peribacillus loiseleuriae TaxID=1679170 RepID=A0A0K9GZ51_9BACI|nr:YdcF family protein [Peribacillus loiseleuriae]KMY51901.1 hypothetical protein AC625_22180 [Peribacillus loiseleuriae]
MVKRKWVILTMIGIVLTVMTLMKEAGDFLVINEKPVKSDVIIVLSGGGIERLEQGVGLYNQGFASYIMISNGQEDGLYEAALKMGVPIDSIILENHASSTTENALFTKKLMVEHQFHSAIVVSSNYHMRRVKSNFTKAISKSRIKLLYSSVPDNGYDSSRWWKTKEGRQTTYMEYAKLTGNFFGFHGNDAKKVFVQ